VIEAEIHAVLDAYFNGLNTEDWEGLEALLCEDAQLEAPGASRSGAAGVARYFRDALGPYPEHLDDPGRRLISGSTATVEIRFSGRMASGAPMAFDAVDVFDFRDGRIARLTSWYDSYEVRRTLLGGLAAGGDARAGVALAGSALRGRLAHALGGRWHGAVPGAPLCLPASVIGLDGDLRPEQLGGPVAGRALLLRGTGAADAALLAGAAAVATDAAAPPAGEGLRGSGFDLAGLPPGDGLLVSAPDPDGSAHAVLLR